MSLFSVLQSRIDDLRRVHEAMRSLESFLTEPERSRGRHVRGEPMSSLSNSNSGLELAWYAPLNGNGKRAAPELELRLRAKRARGAHTAAIQVDAASTAVYAPALALTNIGVTPPVEHDAAEYEYEVGMQVQEAMQVLTAVLPHSHSTKILLSSNELESRTVLQYVKHPRLQRIIPSWHPRLQQAIPAPNQYRTGNRVAAFLHEFVRPDAMSFRPFMSAKAMRNLEKLEQQRGWNIVGLAPGDVLHVPFSSTESDMLLSNTKGITDVAVSAILAALPLLPGRTVEDCYRYLRYLEGDSHPRQEHLVKYEPEPSPPFPNLATMQALRARESSQLWGSSSSLSFKLHLARSMWLRTEHVATSLLPMSTVTALQFSPQCLLAASSESPNELLLYNYRSGTHTKLQGHDGVTSAEFACGGSVVLSGSRDHLLKVWDAASGAQLHSIDTGAPVAVLQPHPQQWHIAASGSSTSSHVSVWNIESGMQVRKLPGMNGHTTAISVNESTLAWAEQFSLSLNSHLTVHELERGEQLFATPLSGAATCLEMLASEPMLCVGAGSCAYLYDQRFTAKVAMLYTAPGSSIKCAAFSACERLLLCGSSDNSLTIYDRRKPGHALHRLAHETVVPSTTGVSSACWLPEQGFVLSGGEEGAARVWDVRLGQPLVATLPAVRPVTPIVRVAANPYGTAVATGGQQGLVALYSPPGLRYGL